MFGSFFRGLHIVKLSLEYGIDKLVWHKLPLSLKIVRYALFFFRFKHQSLSGAERVKQLLQILGPIHIKIGQMLSTRRDLLSAEFAEQLAQLQDNVPPFASDIAIAQIEAALEQPIATLFATFDSEPMASASIAQVHSATLHSGEEVVVKVLRPNVEKQIVKDTQLLLDMSQLIELFYSDSKRLRLLEVIHDYRQSLLDEIDLTIEAQNAIRIRNSFKDSDALYVPYVHQELCRHNIMVMERIYGTPVGNVSELTERHTNMKLLAERGVEVFFTQVFRDNFFHADMHPGNIFVSLASPENPKYIGIDYGIVGTLNNDDKKLLAEVFLAFFNQNYHTIARLYIDNGWVGPATDIPKFEKTIEDVCRPIFAKPLSEISFGNVLLQLFDAARQFDLIVQPQLVLLQKTLLYVEGLGRQLYPQLDLWETAKPFLEQWMQDNYGAKAQYKKIKAQWPQWVDSASSLPLHVQMGIKQLHTMTHQQQQLIKQQQQLLNNQKLQNTLIISAIFAIGAAWCVEKQLPTIAIVLFGFSGLNALVGWLSTRRQRTI